MKTSFMPARQILQRGQELTDRGEFSRAIDAYYAAIDNLSCLKPNQERDALLAIAHLAIYKNSSEKDESSRSLNLGVSYARSTRDPVARAEAEKCLIDFKEREN